MPRQMHLGAFMRPISIHTGAWRNPGAWPDANFNLAHIKRREIVGVSTTMDDVERTKPAPDIFVTALKKLSPLGANEVIVVGDTPYDIEAAAKCGIAAVGVRSGKFSDDTLTDAGAVAIRRHPAR